MFSKIINAFPVTLLSTSELLNGSIYYYNVATSDLSQPAIESLMFPQVAIALFLFIIF